MRSQLLKRSIHYCLHILPCRCPFTTFSFFLFQKLRPLVSSMQASLEQVRVALAGGVPPVNPKINGANSNINGAVNGTSDQKRARDETVAYESFEKELDVHLWIDVPNSFPWRKCLNKYIDRIITYDCAAQVRLG
jgi:hypothetical protein